MSGKGSGRRPGEGYQEAFERIFGEKKRERYVYTPLAPEGSVVHDGIRITNTGAQEVFVGLPQPKEKK